ncbi:MAG: O-antigen ligase family protein [Clostridiales bacterium]|jgi:O-antigen ligase|nr:O-antigen ligase family protein [Clostridiales bacterium]
MTWREIWLKIRGAMDASLFFRAILAVCGGLNKVYIGSVTQKTLSSPMRDEIVRSSRAITWIKKVFNIPAWLRVTFIKDAYEQSILHKLMNVIGRLGEGSIARRAFCELTGAPRFFCPEVLLMAIVAATPFLETMRLAAALGACALLLVFKIMTDPAYALPLNSTGIMIVIYAIAGLFVAVTSLAPADSARIALLTTLLMSVHILLVAIINSRKKLEVMLFVFCTSAACTGLYGAWQKLSGYVNRTWVDKSLFGDVSLRVFSTFDNPNVYGAYLLLAIPVSAVMIYMSRKWFAKLYYAAIMVLLIYNMGYTYSRGCYLALAVGLFVFIMFTEKRLIALLTAIIVCVPFILPSSMLARLVSITNLSDSSTSFRIYIWQATLRMIKDYWMAGLGQGIAAYNVLYPLYMFSNVPAPHSHNLILQVFTELGIWGLIIFVVLLITFFREQLLLFHRTRNNKLKIMLSAWIAAACAFLFQGMFDYVFYNYRVMLTFFVFTGIAGALVNIRTKSDFT